ncbi:MAG TPA: hypothetical protein VGY54_27175 [Polyangiaceae bacterium]|nr:hypothetical protein [Polyangiaceae bacterium]
MARVLPEARTDLREAIRHYRAIKPPAVGKELAARVLDAFKQAVQSVEAMPLSRLSTLTFLALAGCSSKTSRTSLSTR